MYNMVYILLCLATAEACSCGPHGVANDVNMMNMDILVPHRKANAVSYDDCNNILHFRSLDHTYMKELILFVYSWTTIILVVHGNGLQPWSLWPERHPEYQCEVFIPHIKLLIYLWAILDVTAWRQLCTQYVRQQGLLQQMKCLLQKQQQYSGHIFKPIIQHAWKLSFLSGQQQCKSQPNNWKISQIFKFPNKYSGKISETFI